MLVCDMDHYGTNFNNLLSRRQGLMKTVSKRGNNFNIIRVHALIT